MICPLKFPLLRCLLIGANGSGKSTLLKVLAGRHLSKPDEAVTVLGMNAFRDTKLNFVRAYMDMDWGMRTVSFAGKIQWSSSCLLFRRGRNGSMWPDCFSPILTANFMCDRLGYGVPLQADIPVANMMSKLQSAYPERRDELLELLGIDPNWRMHRVSDGQRRYVLLNITKPLSYIFLYMRNMFRISRLSDFTMWSRFRFYVFSAM